MPSTPIPQSQVPVTTSDLTTIPWYRFFHDLFRLAGTELQVGPPDESLASQLAELTKTVQTLQIEPVVMPDPRLVLTNTATLDFPNTVAGAASDLNIAVPDAALGDVVTLGVPAGSVPANGSFFGWVSAVGVVTVRYTNNDLVAAYNPAAGVFRAVATRF